MIRVILISVITVLMYCITMKAQDLMRPKRQLAFSIFNANTLLPGSGDLCITSSVVHHGLDLGVGWSFGIKPKS